MGKKSKGKGLPFVAYIFCGNRQIIRREVSGTKRFMVNEEMYIIKPDCIYLKMIDNQTRSVSYYREGNPNPYDFRDKNNLGISNKDLDRLYAEDFYHIVTDLTMDNKKLYILIIAGINMALTCAVAITIFIGGL